MDVPALLRLAVGIVALAGTCLAQGGGPQEPPKGLVPALEALSHADPGRRQGAQDWLAANLRARDFAAVAQTVQQGSVEVRSRLAAAVGAADAHLELAALALVDVDNGVEAWGRAALHELLLRWDRAALDLPMARRKTPESWGAELRKDLRLEVRPDAWTNAVDRLDRLGQGPAPLVIDASLAENLPARARGFRGEVLAGPWTAVLHTLTGAGGLGYVVQSWRRDDGDGKRSALGTRPWVRVCRVGEDRGATTAALVEGWIRGVQRELDPEGSTAAARALAQHGWPAGLGWLERRWLERADRAGLEGILTAAARGRVVPSLSDRSNVQALWDQVDGGLTTGAPDQTSAALFAERVARALAQAAPTDRDGLPLADLHCASRGPDSAFHPASTWARLVVLEGQALGTPQARDFASEVLFEAAAPSLRLAALRALLACRDLRTEAQGRVLPRERDLFLHGARVGAGRELPAALAAIGALPAEPDAFGLGEDVEPRAARLPRLAWHLLSRAGDPAFGAELLLREAGQQEDLEPLVETLGELVARGTGDALQRVLAELEIRDAGLAGRLRLRLDLATPESERARLDEILAAKRRTRPMWEDLALLAASQDLGWRARAQFVESIEAGGPQELLQPMIERALLALQDRRMDEAARGFLINLRRRAVQAEHPLASVLLGRNWPPPRKRLQRDLERLERRF